jgi:hypothetical protein
MLSVPFGNNILRVREGWSISSGSDHEDLSVQYPRKRDFISSSLRSPASFSVRSTSVGGVLPSLLDTGGLSERMRTLRLDQNLSFDRRPDLVI